MKRLIAVSLLALLAVGCKDDKPPIIASKWIQAPATVIVGDTMKILRQSGEEKIVLMNRWRKYEMFRCGDGKMVSVGFDSTSQSDTLVDMGWGEWITVQEKRERDRIANENFLKGFVVYRNADTVWVR